MATTPIEIPKLPQGLTLTCDIFPRGEDTAAQSGIVLTEETNRKGTYSGSFTGSTSGPITVKIYSGSVLIGELTTTITNTTDLHILEEVAVTGDQVPVVSTVYPFVAKRVIRRSWKPNGVATDVTSAKLSDPTGAYGVKRDDTDAVVVADGAAMTKLETGLYEYSFDAVAGVAYTAYVEFVYQGSTYHFKHEFSAVSTPTVSGYSYDAIRRAVGFLLGFGRDPSNWQSDDSLVIDDTIRDGLMMAYQPPATGEGYVHQWSWLKPLYEFSTEAGEEDYTLPENFEEWEGDIFFDASETSRFAPIRRTSPGRLIEMMQADEAQQHPQWFALFPLDADGTATQRWKLRLYPTPNAVYALVGRYVAAQAMLSGGNPYPLGPRSFSYAVYLACLAAAEAKVSDAPGQWTKQFERRIMAEISADMSRYGTRLGYMGDGNYDFYPSRSDARRHMLITDSRLTYNGSYPSF